MIWQKSKKQKCINVRKRNEKVVLKISSFVGNPVAAVAVNKPDLLSLFLFSLEYGGEVVLLTCY